MYKIIKKYQNEICNFFGDIQNISILNKLEK